MFIDEAGITIQGGDGGPGKVAFFINKKGPCGGNGGKGGDLYFVANANIPDLKKFTEKIFFKAENGQSGGSNRRIGTNGKDLYLPVPINTSIIDNKTKQEIALTEKAVNVLLCRGGNGGLGNDAFKTSINRTPRHATLGQKGQEKKMTLILKLIADFGIIGLPNAGKSSLLNALTRANVKTANYPFTTLEPNLGVFDGKVIADIPGLIEGASKGKGLGIKFLKHIEKVRLILHCISADSENILQDYQVVIDEIASYSKAILQKKSAIVLTKIDLLSKVEVQKKVKLLQSLNPHIIPISIYYPKSLITLKAFLQTYE